MVSTTINAYVDVDVELSEFDTDDLIEELEIRGITVSDEGMTEKSSTELQIEELYEAYTLNQKEKFDSLLRNLFYDIIGRIA